MIVSHLKQGVSSSRLWFVLGPFVYLGHEMACDCYGNPGKAAEVHNTSAMASR
jgi:hypothetical protein